MTPDFGPKDMPVPFAHFENPQSLNLFIVAADDPVSLVDADGHSFFVFDGRAKTVTLYSHDGVKLGTWSAGNNVDSHATMGKLVDGIYPVRSADQRTPHRHGSAGGDTEEGKFGPYGIFRFAPFVGADGKLHFGVGIHAGRAHEMDKAGHKGTEFDTYGCIRTTEAAMAFAATKAKSDPLEYVRVQNNRATPDPGPPPPAPSAPAPSGQLFGISSDMEQGLSHACNWGNPVACR